MGFNLNKREFCDAIKLCHDWQVYDIPSTRVCGEAFTVDHAIIPDKLSSDNFLVTLNNCHSSVKFTMEIENDGMLPFLGTQLLNKFTQIQTKVYVKPTNTGLLLHYKSHVDDRYKRGLLKTMLDWAFPLSSNWSYFSEECDQLKMVFSRLDYPDKLVNSTITHFIADKASDQPTDQPT